MSDEARKLYKAWDIDVGADVKANDWWFMPGFTADLPKDPRSLCHDLDLAKHPWIKVEGWAYYYDGMTYKDLGKAGFRAGQQGPIFPFITPAGGLPYYGLDSPTAKGGDDLQELWRKFPHPREGPLYRVLKAEIQPNGKTTVTAGGINIPDVATAR